MELRISEYKERLVAEEARLRGRMERAGAEARAVGEEPEARDITDESLTNKYKDDEFMEADADWKLLQQVRDALKRIDEGTFGKCMVDGQPIGEKRLQALPWTPYCLKHEEAREGHISPPTL
jgi:RNA polymerase-binding transcription factor